MGAVSISRSAEWASIERRGYSNQNTVHRSYFSLGNIDARTNPEDEYVGDSEFDGDLGLMPPETRDISLQKHGGKVT